MAPYISRLLRIVVLGAIGLFVPEKARTEAIPFRHDVKRMFISSMFSTEGSVVLKGPLRYDKVVRWETTIRISFIGDPQKNDQSFVIAALSQFSSLTKLKVVEEKISPNFILVFASDMTSQRRLAAQALAKIAGNENLTASMLPQFPALASNTGCGMGSTNDAGRITMYVGIIRNDVASRARDRCIELQIMSGVGFHTYDWSELYHRANPKDVSVPALQQKMVELLYSDYLYPGQKFPEVRKLLLGF